MLGWLSPQVGCRQTDDLVGGGFLKGSLFVCIKPCIHLLQFLIKCCDPHYCCLVQACIEWQPECPAISCVCLWCCGSDFGSATMWESCHYEHTQWTGAAFSPNSQNWEPVGWFQMYESEESTCQCSVPVHNFSSREPFFLRLQQALLWIITLHVFL